MDVKTGGMGQLFFYYGVREGAGAPSDEGACQGWPIGVLFFTSAGVAAYVADE